VRAAAAIALLALTGGCSFGPFGYGGPPCTEDSQCGGDQICFPDGCGDPGKNLVVEITANTRSGQYEQDLAISDGSLRPTYDFELKTPMVLSGGVERHLAAGGTGSPLYLEPYGVRATGESTVIPGVTRTYEQSFTNPERGAFSMPIGAGSYTVTTIAADPTIPPVTMAGVKIENGTRAQVSVTFAAIDGTLDLTGRLIKYLQQQPPPSQEIPLIEAAMELEAIDPSTKRPISQRTWSSTGATGSKGDFVMFVDPAAKLLSSFQIIARPRDPNALVPTKTFTVDKPYSAGTTLLQLGEFGATLTGLKGAVLGTDGTPVKAAAVYAEGPIAGGGTFRSKTAVTGDTGEFSIDLIESPVNGDYTLTVLPPAKSSAGVLVTQMRAVPKPGSVPVLEPSRFTCPDKVGVAGVVYRPDGVTVASMVQLVATPVKAVDGRPLRQEATQIITDDAGRFALGLDPGVYRFDFTPGEDIPRMTRYVTVRATTDADANVTPASPSMDLGSFTLSKGRRVTGNVFWGDSSGVSPANAVNAKLRFFRLTTIDGKPGAALLAETVTDSYGVYGVVLPGSPE
jgi:hypothetical protein